MSNGISAEAVRSALAPLERVAFNESGLLLQPSKEFDDQIVTLLEMVASTLNLHGAALLMFEEAFVSTEYAYWDAPPSQHPQRYPRAGSCADYVLSSHVTHAYGDLMLPEAVSVSGMLNHGLRAFIGRGFRAAGRSWMLSAVDPVPRAPFTPSDVAYFEQSVSLFAFVLEQRALSGSGILDRRAYRARRRLEGIWRIVVAEKSFEEKAHALMRYGLEEFGLTFGTLTYAKDGGFAGGWVEPEAFRPPHNWLSSDESMSAVVLHEGCTKGWNNVTYEPAFKNAWMVRSHSVGSYIGSPFSVDSTHYILNLYGTEVRKEPFEEDDRFFMEVLATSMSWALQERKHREQITYVAYHDDITSALNRPGLIHALEERIERSRTTPFSVAFLDIVRFAEINDAVGHAGGNQLLQELCERLHNAVGSHGLVARLSGDDFVLVVDGLPFECEQRLQRITDALAEPFNIDNHIFRLRAEIGICKYPRDGTNAGILIDRANAAMKESKDRRSGPWQWYDPSIDGKISQRRQMVAGLREALAQNKFFICYQPIIDLASKKHHGVEALIRWQNGRVIMPDEFIGVAESSGLMEPIGRWVIHESFRQIAAWNREFGPLHLSVNVSVLQLRSPSFVSSLKTALEESGIDPEMVDLEITESYAVEDPESAVEVLTACRGLGLRITLDDFGTRYSTLSHLKHILFDTVKIDRSFVMGLPGDTKDAAIVRTILALARELNLKCVAEGVEHSWQSAWLREYGCGLAQGFSIGRPMPAGDLESWMRKQRAGVTE